jgi:hypothetical protein
MDDNIATVLLAAIILGFVVLVTRQFDRVSLHLERLNLHILGLLKLSIQAIKITMQRRPESRQWASTRLMQGSFAPARALSAGDHGIDMIVVSNPDDDHSNGLVHLFQCKHHSTSD